MPGGSHKEQRVHALDLGKFGDFIAERETAFTNVFGFVVHAFEFDIEALLQIVNGVAQVGILREDRWAEGVLIELIAEFLEYACDHRSQILFGLPRLLHHWFGTLHAHSGKGHLHGHEQYCVHMFLPDFRSGLANCAKELAHAIRQKTRQKTARVETRCLIRSPYCCDSAGRGAELSVTFSSSA